MTSEPEKTFQHRAAKTISIVFHPLLMPLYGMAIIFLSPTLYGYLPFSVKRLLILIVLINNVILPLSLLPFFKFRNIITTWTIEDRKERFIPLMLTTLLYAATSYIIFNFPIPAFLKSFIFATFFTSLAVTIINFRWKLSIHSVSVGALTAMVLLLSVKMRTPLIEYLIPLILATGLVLTARLTLNLHNPSQVWMGYLTGFLVLGLYLWFF